MATSSTNRPRRAKHVKPGKTTASLPIKSGPPELRSQPELRATTSSKNDLAGGPMPLRSEKEIRLAEGINWPVVGWLVLLHVGALAAPFTFTWQALLLVVFLHWVSGGLGVCLGYHRLLTHSSFETYKPIRWFLALLGGLSGEGNPIDWVANHRKHHAHSDQEGDPHTPHDGNWWSHIFWMVFLMHGRDYDSHVQRWAPDLAKDPSMRFLSYAFLPVQFLMAAVLCGIGYGLGGQTMAVSFLVWGVFLRLVLVMHSTWFVNSASHIWGYRNYKTTDDSRNNWWVAAITYGEGWHNNHHAYPRMAMHGHRWWEIDLTFRTIRLMQRLGLAWNVVDYKRKSKA